MDDKTISRAAQRHRMVIENRERIEITGVLHVDSFDDQEIVLETEQGLMAMRGEDLHIKNLNLEQGELLIEGYLLELAYSDDYGKKARDRGKSFLERLFR